MESGTAARRTGTRRPREVEGLSVRREKKEVEREQVPGEEEEEDYREQRERNTWRIRRDKVTGQGRALIGGKKGEEALRWVARRETERNKDSECLRKKESF